MLGRGNILELSDNNEYTVVDILMVEGITYVYLVDNKDNKNIIFGKLINDEITTVVDPEELKIVVEKFNENLHNDLKEINEMFKED